MRLYNIPGEEIPNEAIEITDTLMAKKVERSFLVDKQTTHHFPKATVDKLLSAIAFYRQVKTQDPSQYDTLMSASRIETFNTGDRVIEQGSNNTLLHFLLSGELDVTANDCGYVVNHIIPGEIFGGLATLLNIPRTATVTVAPRSREAVILSTDFSNFGALRDTSIVSFDTKLLYYQNLVHSLRWQLESNRVHFPRHELAESHRKIKLFVGKRGSWEELESLETQGRALGELILDWNKVLPSLLAEEFEHKQADSLCKTASLGPFAGHKQVYI